MPDGTANVKVKVTGVWPALALVGLTVMVPYPSAASAALTVCVVLAELA